VSDVTASLKALAKEIGIPVLALCQLNREADGNMPRLSNLRESGSIEQDADSVLFLHPEQKGTEKYTLLIVAKNRHGKTGMVKLAFDEQLTRFSQYEQAASTMANYDNRFEAYQGGDF
jgi:replicative DNA helicase